MSVSIDRRKMLAAGICAVAGHAVGRDKPTSSKKGFGIALQSDPEWSEKVQDLNVNWFYTWGAKTPEPKISDVDFIPMIWGKWSCTRETVRRLKDQGCSTLLGFNEPDQYNQSNLEVEEALRLWPCLMESDMRLGSPAGVHADGEWMSAFMRGVEKCGYRVDFIALHSYMGDNPKLFLDRMEKIHRQYKKPLWITEFAVADWEACADRSNMYSQDKVLKFMEAVLPELEKREYVERYAWYSSPYFYHPLNTSVLFNTDGSHNVLGKLYASF